MSTNEEIILHSSSKGELKGIFAEVLKEELSTFFNKESKTDDRLLTRKQAAEILGIALPSLHKFTKNGIIKAFRIGNSVRYKMADVELALQSIQGIKYSRFKL